MTAKKKVAKKVAKKATANASGEFPPGVSQPAIRALASVGVKRVAQLANYRESEIAELHGMGPKALSILKATLTKSGAKFKA